MKIRISLSSLLFISVFFSFNLFGQTIQKDFNWDEYNKKATSLANLQFSPDGNYLLYRTRNADFESNKWVIKNRLLNISTKEDTILQFEQKSVRQIKWSPSGKYLSFIASDNGINQIFIQDFPNGAVKVISKHSSHITNYFWSHNESKITFVSRDPRIEKEESKKFITAFEVGPQGYLSDHQYLPSHLYILDIENDKEERLTNGEWTINSGISWSKNDQKLVFTKKADAYSSRWNESEIMYYDLTTKTLTPFSNNNKFEFGPEFTPIGNHLLYWYQTDKNPAGLTDLYVQYEDKTPINISGWYMVACLIDQQGKIGYQRCLLGNL